MMEQTSLTRLHTFVRTTDTNCSVLNQPRELYASASPPSAFSFFSESWSGRKPALFLFFFFYGDLWDFYHRPDDHMNTADSAAN